MPEIGPEHPLTYRQEIAKPLFDLVRAGESCAVVGSASMGKSRLLFFVFRPDVQQHYLAGAAPSTLLLMADCNRLADAAASEWALYELLLTALEEAAPGRVNQDLQTWLYGLRDSAIRDRDPLLARRHLELATGVLCRQQGLRLCFFLDEFDTSYRSLPASALANLRALRDADRYRVSYVLLLRDRPERIRKAEGCEGFYELFSRSVLGLKPYSTVDAERVLGQLEARRGHPLSESEKRSVLELSGGHPGLIVALFDAAAIGPVPAADEDLTGWALQQPQVVEECRKLWEGLAADAQLALSHLAQEVGTTHSLRTFLELAGLIRPQGPEEVSFFSPLFRAYVLEHGSIGDRLLWFDESAGTVWVEGRPICDLTRLEFDLLRLLHRQLGQVCTRDEILAALHPEELADSDAGGSHNRVDSLVRHLRKAIEPVPEHPIYILTVRGRGYKLVDAPDQA
jgi:hypothetical protein